MNDPKLQAVLDFARENLSITQRDLCKMLGINEKTFSRHKQVGSPHCACYYYAVLGVIAEHRVKQNAKG